MSEEEKVNGFADNRLDQFDTKQLNTRKYTTTEDDDLSKEGSDMGNKNVIHIQKDAATKQTTRKAKLLANPDVKRWHDNIGRGSKVTAEVRLRRLSRFCDNHNMTPMDIIDLGFKDIKSLTDLLEDHIAMMEENGNAPGYINTTIVSLKSWLRHFDIEVKRKLKISNINSTPMLANERVPEADELTELFNRASLRSGAIMSLMAKSGLRPEVLGNYNGTDGLVITDLPDLAVVKGLTTFIRSPPRIVVRQSLSKARHEYFTFMSGLGAKRLLAYLNQRILQGEAMTPDTPVIAPSYNFKQTHKGYTRKFLTTQRVESDVRSSMRPRFSWRPYVLRAFFDTQLLIAESRGKIAHDFRVFFMGHKGSIEAKYTTNKSILPKTLTDEMRESFKRSETLLDLERTDENPVEKQREKVRGDIEGLSPEQLAKVRELVSELSGRNTLASINS